MSKMLGAVFLGVAGIGGYLTYRKYKSSFCITKLAGTNSNSFYYVGDHQAQTAKQYYNRQAEIGASRVYGQ